MDVVWTCFMKVICRSVCFSSYFIVDLLCACFCLINLSILHHIIFFFMFIHWSSYTFCFCLCLEIFTSSFSLSVFIIQEFISICTSSSLLLPREHGQEKYIKICQIPVLIFWSPYCNILSRASCIFPKVYSDHWVCEELCAICVFHKLMKKNYHRPEKFRNEMYVYQSKKVACSHTFFITSLKNTETYLVWVKEIWLHVS